jgi:purine-binding chemotaxis protein CheW
LPDQLSPVLIARLGDRPVAFPASAVDHVELMAEPTPLPGPRGHVVGVLNVRGSVLPVVDPRRLLQLASVEPRPQHHLILMSARTRYLLWVDQVDRMASLPLHRVKPSEPGGALVLAVVVDASETIPVLSPEVLDPGPILTPDVLLAG